MSLVLTTLFLILDEIALMADRLGPDAQAASPRTGSAPETADFAATYGRMLRRVLAVARASAVSKAILVPAALLISAFAAWAVLPLLMLGGVYLCYEGALKIVGHQPRRSHRALNVSPAPAPDTAASDRHAVAGAIRTDFVLSAELTIIVLAGVAEEGLVTQIGTLVGVAVLATLGIYGSVAGLLSLDSAGLRLSRTGGDGAVADARRWLGRRVMGAAPPMMRGLSRLGTTAAFVIGGGILTTGLPGAEAMVAGLVDLLTIHSPSGRALGWLTGVMVEIGFGVIVGVGVVGVVAAARPALDRLGQAPRTG